MISTSRASEISMLRLSEEQRLSEDEYNTHTNNSEIDSDLDEEEVEDRIHRRRDLEEAMGVK